MTIQDEKGEGVLATALLPVFFVLLGAGQELLALLLLILALVIESLWKKGLKAICQPEGILLKEEDKERFLYRDELRIEYLNDRVLLHCGEESWSFRCSGFKQTFLEEWEAQA
ncbi:MAG: hypothetical protein IKE21_07170 [Erysipelotrichaceae bacterium]|nr:hypothetical protein [Erysipelotrichaceae bacterium]